jgi:hypothetical protein
VENFVFSNLNVSLSGHFLVVVYVPVRFSLCGVTSKGSHTVELLEEFRKD